MGGVDFEHICVCKMIRKFCVFQIVFEKVELSHVFKVIFLDRYLYGCLFSEKVIVLYVRVNSCEGGHVV